ncbi:3-phosphoshikimate 1-carboxyvinyltransferase [uncultured Mailhella sp.]|uniref:3-phosphoshikimate 1-carboxyvinyltransferase n=1 Tax=uncultured Mailhella sp. TaxID=1981031 RepID=UPI00261CAA77|nr:3-phosphoshikimate 1-carboxyvinyltransferase [uncultured Mailhella sp.]
MITLQAPSSKSVSHRMLIAAALARGESRIRRVLASADLERTRNVLQAAGARLDDLGGGNWSVKGMDPGPRGGVSIPADCYVGESGTTCRLLTAVLAAGRGAFHIHGAARMHERPIGALTRALSALGADIEYEGADGYPPLVLRTNGLSGGDVELSVDASSQYLSGLLLAAPLCASALRVTLTGSKVVSWPYVGLTLQVLEDYGIAFRVEEKKDGEWQCVSWRTLDSVRPGELRIKVEPGAYRPGEYTVEGDWSGASYLLAAGAVGRESVLVTGLRPDSLQGDRAILDILRSMGAECSVRPDGILVAPSALHGIEVDMGDCPDLVPTAAVTAAFAEGFTRITGIAHLRIKECDRISACAAILEKAGIRAEETQDTLTVHGVGPAAPIVPAGTVFPVQNDHRMAMSAALLGLAPGNDITVDDPAVVSKSFPEFWNVWSALR